MSIKLAATLLGLLCSLVFAPFLLGIINRVKARIGGRQGRPLLQNYYDIIKLWKKQPVYASCSTWIFKVGPIVSLTAAVSALCFMPFGILPSLFGFTGDFILVAGLFGLARFFLILSALDTGNSFEGMGSAREALFGALGEPILLFFLASLAYQSGQFSLGVMVGGLPFALWVSQWGFFILMAVAFFFLLLVENCRLPVDDPNTHLELTMIHEVMVLDHSGPDLALLHYAACVKLWVFSLMIANLLLPDLSALLTSHMPIFATQKALTVTVQVLATLTVIFSISAVIGVLESVVARARMERVPQVLTLAGAFVCLSALLLWS